MSKIQYYTGFEIHDEDDVVRFLLEIFGEPFLPIYPKVTKISRNIVVSPDIDLLVIKNEKTIGYETKYIKYSTGQNRYIYESIYKGLGQALLYLNYGVETAFLTIAYENHYEIPYAKRLLVQKKIDDVLQSINNLGLDKYLGLEVIEIYHDYFSYRQVIEPKLAESVLDDSDFSRGLAAGRNFTILPDTHAFQKDCILKDQISYDKTLIKKQISLTKHNSIPFK